MPTYNGWTNYETWAVHLWLTNDEGTYDECRRHARRADGNVGALAEDLKRDTNENAPDLGATMYADLLNAALGEVDWYEIAEHFIEEIAEAEGEG